VLTLTAIIINISSFQILILRRVFRLIHLEQIFLFSVTIFLRFNIFDRCICQFKVLLSTSSLSSLCL